MTLLQYMEQNGLKPYSRTSPLIDAIPLGHQHLGDIATGKRTPSAKTAMGIVTATDGAVTIQDLFATPPAPPAPQGTEEVSCG